MTNLNVLPAVIALAGVKGNFNILAAVQDVNAGALHAIYGNTRTMDGTIAAIPKGKTKEGNFANNQQGLVLSAFVTAAVSSRTYFEQLHNNNGKLNKKLSADDKVLAQNYANSIAEQFLTSYNLGAASMKAAKAETTAKTAETNAAKKAAEKLTNEIKEQEQRLQAERAANDSFSLDQLLKAIKGGNIEALSLAEQIADVLTAYKLNKANKAAFIADKKAKANLSPVKLAA